MGEDITPPKIAEEEKSISTSAIDFEKSSFLEENPNKGNTLQKDIKQVADTDNNDAEEYEKQFLSQESTEEPEEVDPTEKIDSIIKEIAEQPFEVAMSNLEVSKEDIIKAAEGIFSKNGYFEMEFDLPFGGHITLRSKTINDFIDYNEYVRRLLLEPISKREFDTITELRHLAYALVELDGDDYSSMGIEDKFKLIRSLSDVKITAILNKTVRFWRVAHLLLHPGLTDFLMQTPEE